MDHATLATLVLLAATPAQHVDAPHALPAAQAKEIAFTRNCATGVPVADGKGGINCGQLSANGAGYVIEMAAANGQTDCPAGYSFLGRVADGMAAHQPNAEMRYACVKN